MNFRFDTRLCGVDWISGKLEVNIRLPLKSRLEPAISKISESQLAVRGTTLDDQDFVLIYE